MLKKIAFMIACASCASLVCALTPLPRSITQAKLDWFMADYEKLHKSGVLDAEFEKAMQDVNLKLWQEPGVAEDAGEASLNLPFLMITKTAAMVKKSSAANAELAKYKWGPEYWDVFIAVTFTYQYSQMADSLKRSAGATDEDSEGDEEQPAMKPIAYYMDAQDYALILQNKDKINESMQTHSGLDAGK